VGVQPEPTSAGVWAAPNSDTIPPTAASATAPTAPTAPAGATTPTYEADLDEAGHLAAGPDAGKSEPWEALAAAIKPVYGPHLPPSESSSSSSSSSDEQDVAPPTSSIDPAAAAASDLSGHVVSGADTEPACKKPRMADEEHPAPPSPAETVPADRLCPGLAESSPAGSSQPDRPKSKTGGKKGKRAKKCKKQQVVEEATGTTTTKGKKAKRSKGKKAKKTRSDLVGPASSAIEPTPGDGGTEQNDIASQEPPEIIAVATWHHERAQVYFAKADTYRREASRFERRGRRHIKEIFTKVKQWRASRATDTTEAAEPAI
jgi:hypothetical protein